MTVVLYKVTVQYVNNWSNTKAVLLLWSRKGSCLISTTVAEYRQYRMFFKESIGSLSMQKNPVDVNVFVICNWFTIREWILQ